MLGTTKKYQLSALAIAIGLMGCSNYVEQATVAKAPKRQSIEGVTVVSDRASGMTYLVSNLEVTPKTVMGNTNEAAMVRGQEEPVAMSLKIAAPPSRQATFVKIVEQSSIAGTSEIVRETPKQAAKDAVKEVIKEAPIALNREMVLASLPVVAAGKAVEAEIASTEVVKTTASVGLSLKVDYALESWSQVYFAYGSSTLGPHARGVLTRAVAGKENSDRVLVAAMADLSGDAQKNRVLVAKRGGSVKQFLVAKGIAPSKINVRAITVANVKEGESRALGALVNSPPSQAMAVPSDSHARLRRAEVAFLNKIPGAQGE